MVFQFFKSSYTKLKSSLWRASQALSNKIQDLFKGKIDESTLEKLEEILYEADFGVHIATNLTEKMKQFYRSHPHATMPDYLQALRTELLAICETSSPTPLPSLPQTSTKPHVCLIVGVNGNGKTTSVAKLAHLYQQSQAKVLIAAADTFRAAAIEQLQTWSTRLGTAFVKGKAGSDPAAVAYDAIEAAKARQYDIVLIDTAGRLHTKTPLMQELAKIKRSCAKSLGSDLQEILLVLDATTGQNAIDQAKQFHQFTPLTGLILTKLDGTAKGGIALAIQKEIGVPIKFIGIGEQIEDLQPFIAKEFIQQLIP